MKNKKRMQVPCSRWAGQWISSCGMAMLVALAFVGTTQAGIIAQNETVPAAMIATGGTQSDPSVYVFDNYAKDFGSTSIAIGTAIGASWIRLEIRNGATVTTTGTANRLGSDNAAYTNAFNSVVVTGPGSALTIGSSRMGGMSPNNSLIITEGGTVNLTGDLSNGFNNTPVATNNTIVVDNATLNIVGEATRFRLGYGTGHDYNTLVVRNGGVVAGVTGRIGTRNGKYCDYRVEGVGSRIEIGYVGMAFTLGESATTHHNTITLVDGGVIKLTSASSTLSITVDTNQGGSGVRFAQGFLAVMGNRTTHVPANRAWLWDGDSWEPAPGDWVGTYYADETAAAAAGRPGFGGYTVFTGGKSIAGALKTTVLIMK